MSRWCVKGVCARISARWNPTMRNDPCEYDVHQLRFQFSSQLGRVVMSRNHSQTSLLYCELSAVNTSSGNLPCAHHVLAPLAGGAWVPSFRHQDRHLVAPAETATRTMATGSATLPRFRCHPRRKLRHHRRNRHKIT